LTALLEKSDLAKKLKKNWRDFEQIEFEKEENEIQVGLKLAE